MTTLEQNLERILKVRPVDLGLFVLAMHSLIERSGNYDTENSFGKLLNRYLQDYYNSHGKPVYNGSKARDLPKDESSLYKTLQKLFKSHEHANSVRHKFEVISPEDAQVSVKYFLAFAQA